MGLPREVDEEIAATLFAEMRRIGWAGLTNPERSAQYAKWVTDPEIGGRLTQFMSAARARVWIKDGPVKEYPRAVAGVGKYAQLIDVAHSHIPSMVTQALGPEWHAQLASLQVKPLRVTAYRSDDELVVAWGPSRDLKHLVWAALLAEAQGDPREWVLAITSTFTRPVSTGEKILHSRIGHRIGIRIIHVEIR